MWNRRVHEMILAGAKLNILVVALFFNQFHVMH